VSVSPTLPVKRSPLLTMVSDSWEVALSLSVSPWSIELSLTTALLDSIVVELNDPVYRLSAEVRPRLADSLAMPVPVEFWSIATSVSVL
jgi:hypothetical protein